MSLYFVAKKNPYVPMGSWVECFEEGCQRVRVRTEDNRLVPMGHEGLILELRTLRPFMMRPLKRGLDK